MANKTEMRKSIYSWLHGYLYGSSFEEITEAALGKSAEEMTDTEANRFSDSIDEVLSQLGKRF